MLYLELIGQLSLYTASAYIFHLCFTDPNPTPPAKPNRKLSAGRLSLFALSIPCFIYRYVPTLFAVYYGLLSLLRAKGQWDALTTFCPAHSDPFKLFTLSQEHWISFGLIFIFGLLRLECYRALGLYFQYQIQEPGTLIEIGPYKYVRHPSYTAGLFLCLAFKMLYQRSGGVLGCFLGSGASAMNGWIVWAPLCWMVVYVAFTVAREEKLLKGKFGHKWDVYKAQRARFVPYVF